MTNTKLLYQKIEDSGLKHSYIAMRIGMTKQGFSKKLHDRTEFKPSQINVLCELLHIVDPDERREIFLI